MLTRITLPTLAIVCLVLADPSAPGRPSPAGPALRQAEDDDRAYELELGRRSFEGNCLMCHSVGMVDAQRLTAEQWAAEVEKMIGWGAPVPPEEKEGLIAYLIATYPTDADAAEIRRMTLDEARLATRPEPDPDALPPGDSSRGATLHAEHCATCHGPDARGGDLGVNLIARPVLRRPAEYAEVLQDGRRRMPGFRLVLSPEQVADTLAWLRSRPE